ncbi:hypothetical protein LshimejAT787_0211150 [Lyophyllum shimeji]|uniref:Expansin-like EG45 domain-containing protein n=1 Tax=Lyophyllum shimeji TaxID=47721 RepID=A0A9P3PGD1_LYOSH|nr:hypothetical protein LshimejAT787_0211150 [Lyophyllum shimeji]
MYKTLSLGFVLGLISQVTVVNAVAGVTTFNDYGTQSTVACPGFSPSNSQGNGIFAAAMSDLSPLWTGSPCQGTKSASNCNGHGGCINCAGPACPNEQQCGHCFNVRCTGSLDGETSGACSGRTIKVKIIDACPATHPANYCKTAAFGGTVPDREACEAVGVNALDIATTARSALSSFQGNLNIDI